MNIKNFTILYILYYIYVTVVIYLVSFVSNLPLLSRNSNFTLMQENGTYGRKGREMKNIRGNGNALLPLSHSFFFNRQYL